MGKRLKFTEDQLLDAVVRYSKVHRGKIKATELAEWSRANIPELMEVRDYHFTRPVNVKDEKTSKMCHKMRACAIRINEINQTRSVVVRINSNMLLKSSNPFDFLKYSEADQKKLIIDTRTTFSELEQRNIKLERENATYRKINAECLDGLKRMELMQKEIERNIGLLEKRLNYIMRVTDEEKRRKILEDIGIRDGEINLETYMKNIKNKSSEIFNINKELSAYYQYESDSIEGLAALGSISSDTKKDKKQETRDLILNGLFGNDQFED